MNGYGTIHDLFTIVPSATLGSLTVATCFATNAIAHFAGGSRKWIGAGIALGLNGVLAAYVGGDALSYLAVVSNAAVVYVGAVGLTSYLVATASSRAARGRSAVNDDAIFQNWLPGDPERERIE